MNLKQGRVATSNPSRQHLADADPVMMLRQSLAQQHSGNNESQQARHQRALLRAQTGSAERRAQTAAAFTAGWRREGTHWHAPPSQQRGAETGAAAGARVDGRATSGRHVLAEVQRRRRQQQDRERQAIVAAERARLACLTPRSVAGTEHSVATSRGGGRSARSRRRGGGGGGGGGGGAKFGGLEQSGGVIDYCWMHLAKFADLREKLPWNDAAVKRDALSPATAATALKLHKNAITGWDDFGPSVSAVVPGGDSRALRWLDLSCNLLERIDGKALVAHCPNLTSLALHGNRVKHLREVKSLRGLRQLTTLTLHGNLIAESESDPDPSKRHAYVALVLRTLPNLRKLDNTVITEGDRRLARLSLPLAEQDKREAGREWVKQKHQLWESI